MRRHPELRPLSRGHQPLLVHARDLRWRAAYLERGDAHLRPDAWPAFRAWASRALEPHLLAEETVLLPRLRALADAAVEAGDGADVAAALDEDLRLREALRAAVRAGSAESVATLRAVAEALDAHARHGEHVLFPLAEGRLADAGLAGLCDALGVYEI